MPEKKPVLIKKVSSFIEIKMIVKTSPPKIKKKKKRNPATVFERLQDYYKKHFIKSIPSLEIRQEVGNLVKDAFFNNPEKKNRGAYKKEVEEPDGKFSVLIYPGYFIPVIDSIILNYFKR